MNRPPFLPLLALLAACNGPAGAPPTPPTASAASDTVAVARPDSALVRDGHQQVRDTEGRLLMEGDVRNGKRHGLWTAYHPNGAVQSRNEYRDGVLHGLTTTFRPDGALLYRGQNANGHPVGSWSFHDAIGTQVRTVEYDSTGAEVVRR